VNVIKNDSKLISLDQAVSRYVKGGSHISIGGFTLNRNPMAAVHEIIRQEIKGLHIYACFGLYYDTQLLDLYRKMTSDNERFKNYIKKYILGTKNHAQFLDKACKDRIEQIKADPEKLILN
jgi:acyl CoA:acetate/3-ketoacid CoA transferase alpha subunit